MPGHVAHSKRERDDQNDGQALGNDGDKYGNGDNELLHEYFLEVNTWFAIRHDKIERNEEDSHHKCDDAEKLSEAFEFQLQRCFGRLRFRNVACDFSKLGIHAGSNHQTETSS